VVTGASSGIGEAVVSRLLNDGWEVIGVSRSPSGHDSPDYHHLPADLGDFELLRSALMSIDRVDAIAHCAGLMRTAPLGSLKTEDGRAMWAIHVEAAAVLVDSLVDRLSDGGRVVLMGSRTSAGAAGRSQYVATKAALIGMARSWAAELLPRRISVNVVAPGATETPMLLDPKRVTTPPKQPPMGRFIQPEEVAGTVAFLFGPDAGMITGQQIVICGGSSL
jgi:NAD(P)-dependent dehydrogenase (short-subunit alcohol dehydrogenase family)